MDYSKPITVDFPLKGEWTAPHTPGDKVPSHGTDALGQRFAYDFFRTEMNLKRKFKFYKTTNLKYNIIGISINDCYCYKENIYSPVNGTVIVVKDGVKEPKHLHPVIDLVKVLIRSFSVSVKALFVPVSKINLHKYIGNYVIIEFDELYAFFAHISTGTICVQTGQILKKGDRIGLVGHTGNSTAPHLHFHLMDSSDLLTARGVPCAFTKYDILTEEGWKLIENDIPKSDQRIRLI